MAGPEWLEEGTRHRPDSGHRERQRQSCLCPGHVPRAPRARTCPATAFPAPPAAGPQQVRRQRMGRAGVRHAGRCWPPRGGGDRGAPGPARLRGRGRNARHRPSPAGGCLLPPRRPSPRAKLDGSRRAPLASFSPFLPAGRPYALPCRPLPRRIHGRGLPGPARRAARPGLTLRNAAGGMCMQMRWMLISC